MRLTKFEHACMALEKNGVTLVIDPGNLTNDFAVSADTHAVILTHRHPDHTDPQKIRDILAINTNCVVLAHPEVIESLQGEIDKKSLREVTAGETIIVGGVQVRFTGGEHAVIHRSMTRLTNLGVLIDEGDFFYPGDALEVPDCPIQLLALPASAPWMKVSETIDYVTQVAPRVAIPVHDAILSDSGKGIIDNLLSAAAQKVQCRYQRLDRDSSYEW